MAKNQTAVPAAGKLVGKTLAFVGKFGYGGRDLAEMLALTVAEGGTVVEDPQSAPDYLVAGAGVGGNPPAAVTKIQKKHPQVHVLDEAGFYQLTNPTTAEFVQVMLAGSHKDEFWVSMQQRLSKGGVTLDLTGNDFRNRTIEGILHNVCLNDCDFRGAKITAYFDKVQGANFDGATFVGGSLTNAQDCSFKNVTMNNTRWNPANFIRCDFSGAKLNIQTGNYTTSTDCIFRKTDLSGGDLDNSRFKLADFSGANLTDARLEKCDFTGANLTGANLTRADLRNAKFVNADLRKAKFNAAALSGADLTGAVIDGADFTGANVTDATVMGLDVTKAKNLSPKAARPIGPNMRELAKVAFGSQKFNTSIELRLGKDELVRLYSSVYRYGNQAYAGAQYSHEQPKHSMNSSLDSPTFEQGMLKLTDMWARGTPDFGTVKVEAQKCPLRGQELKDLAIAAWHEACGLQVPTKDDLHKEAERLASHTASLREVMIAELHGGAAGVKKWNERSQQDHGKLGKLRKHDFSNAKLAGVVLGSQNLEGSTFEGANLKGASFGGAQLKGVTFANANLSGAHLAGSKPADVSFEGANLSKCNLRAANFLRCNFRNADLTGADFSFANIGGADFSGATLTNVTFDRTTFDEKTIFPVGFIPPAELEWKGAGPRPGTPAAPPPPQAGTLDFDAFLQQLNNKMEAARMQKAGAMLKAERFQLFAEVKDDGLAGIVKSQSSQELVYSCRLESDGAFGCCTQNLRPCGGLRGALCKHLLVLIVGLAKAGQLDPATVNHWVDLSGGHKPAIDEESMSATFLRYKGAEAGEVDWRPTETIPEDFYSM